MPSSLIIGALSMAWLVVLVPMASRRRGEVGRTADWALAARVVRGRDMPGGFTDARTVRGRAEGEVMADHDEAAVHGREPQGHAVALEEDRDPGEQAGDDGFAVDREEHDPAGPDRDVDSAGHLGERADLEWGLHPEVEQDTTELPLPRDEDLLAAQDEEYVFAEDEDLAQDGAAVGEPERERLPARPYRPGRGGYDQRTAEMLARAKYALRRRVVAGMLIAAVGTALVALAGLTLLWWCHLVVDLALVGYLSYLRRQVRIEQDVRARRAARLRAAAREPQRYGDVAAIERQRSGHAARRAAVYPGAKVVDLDDDDPAFDELGDPERLPYRRAVGA